ncbi:MAG: PHP domain-containing protein [Spirochaetales bacterium]|uniref:PHP domain-containing protein n=1 Tax=Candidatus Thalassospirochaeta sargassi TaxID=3119039 RepID=A0AAJ1IC92_9SPIO|nr:PHP domain-containing protein [Spirochaetales bacterium]
MICKADLHIHSCLSPCGSLEMSPSLIARQAFEKGLQAAALTDHNSALNCRAFAECCRQYNILPIYGLEVTSSEEAHIVCLFETIDAAETFGEIIYAALPDIPNNPEKFGDQVYVDAEDNILGEVDKHLVTAVEMNLDEIYEAVAGLAGMFIPAHIDKPLFSIPSQLGFLPDMKYTALETTSIPCPIDTADKPLIMNSDAHYPDDIAGRTSLYEVDEVSYQGIRTAIINKRIDFI